MRRLQVWELEDGDGDTSGPGPLRFVVDMGTMEMTVVAARSPDSVAVVLPPAAVGDLLEWLDSLWRP